MSLEAPSAQDLLSRAASVACSYIVERGKGDHSPQAAWKPERAFPGFTSGGTGGGGGLQEFRV